MIELFTFGSTNGHKVAIALEELGLPYNVQTINVFAGEGQSPEFLALNPTGNRAGFSLDGHSNLMAWFDRVGSRPAVARGVTIPSPLPRLPERKRV